MFGSVKDLLEPMNPWFCGKTQGYVTLQIRNCGETCGVATSGFRQVLLNCRTTRILH